MDNPEKPIKKGRKAYLDISIAILVILSIVSIILEIMTSLQPQTADKTIIKNEIEEKISFESYSIVHPSTLYPAGGKIIPKGIILIKLTDDFVIKIKTSVMAKHPVSINCKKNIIYRIRAENLWEKEFAVIKNASYVSKPTSDFTKSDEIHLNLKEIYNFITKVEDETSIRHNYFLEVKQTLSGDIADENNAVIRKINNEYIIPFEISGQYIKYRGETDNNETSIKSLIKETQNDPDIFYFLGLNIPLTSGKLWFGIAAAITIALLIICIILRSNSVKYHDPDKGIDGLEKKYKNRIIVIKEAIDLKSATRISVGRLKDLFRIADEKDESVYKYSDESKLLYYMVTPPAVYFYEDNGK